MSKLNPLNYMPHAISQAPSPHQTAPLPVSRSTSSIPRGDGTGNWEYPSPQQMYNAMLRKGASPADTPLDAVESMVAVHNFLNEGAWAEILEWERRFCRGLAPGWRISSRGGEAASLAQTEAGCDWREDGVPPPQLARFQGRPGELTPKARALGLLARVYPAGFHAEPPFDRHDWFVTRRDAAGGEREVRYVIDYYGGGAEGGDGSGMPVFYLDVRPAVDSPTQAAERLLRWGGDVWWRASGGVAREREALRQKAVERSRS